MVPVGKKYLVKCEVDKSESHEEDGIIILNDTKIKEDVFWKGTIVAYGTGWTEEEKKELIPIGSEVVLDYSINQNKKLKSIKVIIGKDVFFLQEPDEILGVFEDD